MTTSTQTQNDARLLSPETLGHYELPNRDMWGSERDGNPPTWHLAHIAWFFETFILAPFDNSYRPLHIPRLTEIRRKKLPFSHSIAA